ncbi:hypothetical protein SAY86_000536 [Trapa natans]|uniref:Ubiquitin-like protease family profile domain-containing protein n=1 Tax=Trapa natans TaxID=22666 RepID=A0AAN7M463_TRANT|nr:hypothetical protein SAY86_000536 [Trapa natans]
MKDSSCRSLEVFDFKKEDELPEIAARKYLKKFRYSSGEDHALNCTYLEWEVEMKTSTPNGSSPEESPSNSPILDSSSNDKSVDLNSDADENVNEHASTSDIGEGSLNGQSSCFPVGSIELVGSSGELMVFPEYVIYKASYYTEPLLTFSKSSVKVEASTALGKERSFIFECSVDNIVGISCQCFSRVEMVLIKLNVISDHAVQDDIMHRSSGGDDVDISHWKHYLPVFDQPFEELIYPKGDPDAVSISKRDVDLLLPEIFVNDTIIDFYIKYLMNHIHQEDSHRYHFFNSFFFRKLADMDKDPSSANDGRAAFLRVCKWTRRINLFEKDYIFIPVNFNLHWSLIVICHPGEVANFSEEDVTKAVKVPCILHMDSLKGSHTGIKNLVQSYLWEEWKEKGNDTSGGISSKFSNLRFVPLELPQQENLSDCGLFLLHYLELFLAEAPPTFNPFKISKFSRYLNADWFLPSEASLKRTVIQKLIYGLLDGQSRGTFPANFSDKHLSPEILETKVKNRCTVETLAGMSNAVIPCLSVPEANKENEIDLLVDPSVRNSQCASNESGFVLKELFNPSSSGGVFLGHCQSFNEHYCRLDNAASAMEDDAELSAQFDYLAYGTCGETDVQEIGRNSQKASGVSYSTNGGFVGTIHTWKSEISLMGMVENEVESLENTACIAEDSEVAVLKNNNHKPEDTTPSENLNTEACHPLLVEVIGEPGRGDFSAPPTFTGPLKSVIIDDEIHDRLGPKHENLGSFHPSSAKLRHRGADLEGSELAQEWKEDPCVVVDEAVEPPIVAAAIGYHREPTESMEVEQSLDGEKAADPTEDLPAKRRRMDP